MHSDFRIIDYKAFSLTLCLFQKLPFFQYVSKPNEHFEDFVITGKFSSPNRFNYHYKRSKVHYTLSSSHNSLSSISFLTFLQVQYRLQKFSVLRKLTVRLKPYRSPHTPLINTTLNCEIRKFFVKLYYMLPNFQDSFPSFHSFQLHVQHLYVG